MWLRWLLLASITGLMAASQYSDEWHSPVTHRTSRAPRRVLPRKLLTVPIELYGMATALFTTLCVSTVHIIARPLHECSNL